MQAARGTPLTGPAAASQSEPPDRASKAAGTRTAPRRVAVLVAIALTVLAVDIATKVTIVATLSDRAPLSLIGGLLRLGVWRNPGAAFSIGTSMTLVFSAIAVGVIVYILRTSRRIHSLAWALALGLLLGGATGNLTDRIFRSPAPLRGFVVDWIQVPHWPVFNVADSSIVCGGILAVLLAARGIGIDGLRIDGRRPSGGPAAASSTSAASATSAASSTSAALSALSALSASSGSAADDQDHARPAADGQPQDGPRQPPDGIGTAPGSDGA